VDVQPDDPHAGASGDALEGLRDGVGMDGLASAVGVHDLRHSHGTLLIAAGVHVKVVSERLGHATPSFTIETYQHVLPGMQADAARVFEQLVAPGGRPADQPSEKSEKTREKRRRKTA